MQLLGEYNGTVHPPEFHKALNLEYKVRHQKTYRCMHTANNRCLLSGWL